MPETTGKTSNTVFGKYVFVFVFLPKVQDLHCTGLPGQVPGKSGPADPGGAGRGRGPTLKIQNVLDLWDTVLGSEAYVRAAKP